MSKITKLLKENWIFLLLLTGIIGFFICFFVTKVDGESMTNTLKDDKIILCSRFSKPNRDDIIVCDADNGKRLIKRVIAKGGDTIIVSDGKVTVNGEVLDEPYIREPMTYVPENSMTYPLTVPEGKLFVMGDNRNASNDSRDSRYGLISEEKVIGKVLFH
jgi:signal peptidase I